MERPDLPPPPRRVRYRDGYVAEIVACAVRAGMLAVAMTFVAVRCVLRQRRLVGRGIVRDGTVARRWWSRGKSVGHHVEDPLSLPGGPLVQRFDADDGAREATQPNLPVPILYDPQGPTGAALFGLAPDEANLHIDLAAGVLPAGLGLAAWGFADEARRARLQRRALGAWPVGALRVEGTEPRGDRKLKLSLAGTLTGADGGTRPVRRVPAPKGCTVGDLSLRASVRVGRRGGSSSQVVPRSGNGLGGGAP